MGGERCSLGRACGVTGQQRTPLLRPAAPSFGPARCKGPLAAEEGSLTCRRGRTAWPSGGLPLPRLRDRPSVAAASLARPTCSFSIPGKSLWARQRLLKGRAWNRTLPSAPLPSPAAAAFYERLAFDIIFRNFSSVRLGGRGEGALFLSSQAGRQAGRSRGRILAAVPLVNRAVAV